MSNFLAYAWLLATPPVEEDVVLQIAEQRLGLDANLDRGGGPVFRRKRVHLDHLPFEAYAERLGASQDGAFVE